MPEPLVEEIRAYLRAGYDLIPLHRWDARDERGAERGKSPRDGGWRDAQYAEDAILGWAGSGFNVGVRLRDTDLVIDYDPRNSPDGEAVLSLLEVELGVDLAIAPKVRTGSGGFHFYFSMPAGSRVRNHLPQFPGVEFKSHGRQVVAAGSVHPSGNPYAWEGGVDLDFGAPEAPESLLSAIRKPAADSADAMLAAGAPPAISVEDMAAMLAQLPAEEFREHDEWLKIMMACHSGTSGAGRDEFVRWSMSDPMYASHGQEIAERWRSLSDKPGGVTIASLYWHVLDAGGTLPRSSAADDFDEIPDEPAGEDDPLADVLGAPSAMMERDKNGRPKPTMQNAMIGVQALGINSFYDELADMVVMIDSGFIRAKFPRLRLVLDDQMIVALKALLAENYGLEVSTEKLFDAVMGRALADYRNPLVEWLDGLEWDHRPRIETWLTEYAGAEDSPYTRAVGRGLLVGAVARAYQPGVKYDTMTVLEGPQGVGKSSLLRVIGAPYTLEGLPHTDERDIVDAMRGYWIVEMEELAHLQRAEVNQLKAFLSRTSDRARLAYARATKDYPRRCVFVGTTNDSTYLRDSTGNRRFLPVEVRKIDLPRLAMDRDLLWAEARLAWLTNPSEEALTLPVALREIAAGEQEARRVRDPWEDAVESALGKLGVDRVTTRDLLAKVAFKDATNATQSDYLRMAKVMQRFPEWVKGKFRSEESIVNGYVRSSCCGHNADNHERGVCMFPGCGCVGGVPL